MKIDMPNTKRPFYLATFVNPEFKQTGPSEVTMAQQVEGTRYLVERFPTVNDMYNNQNRISVYDSTNYPVNALPISAGQCARLTLTKDGYQTLQATLQAV